jgi:tRNA (guanosine-2'-O-)-methyltransferase
MRRSSVGVKGRNQLIPALIAEVERLDPQRVIATLEPFVNERRRARIQQVIAARLASVSVLFDAPYDPHNGAAVMRSCDAFGVQYLHVVEREKTFLWAETVTRGADKWVDVIGHVGAPSALAAVNSAGYTLVAAHPDGDLSPADLAPLGRIALVLGNEHDGIAADLLAGCTQRVRVPMRGFVESLNVSVTAAILLQAATANRAGDLPQEERARLYARGLYLSYAKAAEALAE